MNDLISRAIKKVLKSPLTVPSIVFSMLICRVRSVYYTSLIDNGGGKISITQPFIIFKITKHKTAKLTVKGNFRIVPHIGGNSPVILQMDKNSRLEINGDFVVGQGVRFCLTPNSTLIIGGKQIESDSGITADTLIMVYKKIEIGKDFVCAWNIFISDSDWHQIEGQNHQADVVIGNHVWIANNNNILKGTMIGNNCIVASNSKIINKVFPDNVLIAGTPAKIIKTNIVWKRDI